MPGGPAKTIDRMRIGNLAVLDLLSTPVFLFDMAAESGVWANKAALMFWEAKDASDLCRRLFGAAIPPATRIFLASVRERLTAGAKVTEFWPLHPSSGSQQVRLSFGVYPDEDGRHLLLVEAQPMAGVPEPGFAGAAGQPVQGGDARRPELELLQDLVESDSDWVWEMDAGLRVTYLSDSARSALGGMGLGPVDGSDGASSACPDRTGEIAPLLSAIATRQPFRDLVLTLSSGTGASRHVQVSGTPLFGADGEFRGYRGIVADVTERVSMQSRLAALFDGAPIGIAIHTLDGRVVAANPSLHAMGDFPPGGIIGRSVWEFLADEDAARLRDGLADLVAGRQERLTAVCLVRGNEGREFWISVNSGLIRGPDGKPDHVAAVVIDVTEQLAAEAERSRLQEQFHQAQKMDALGRIAGGVAHDFNNILAAIMGYATVLADAATDAQAVREYGLQILRAGERGKALVRQLLTFGRPGAAERRAVDLEAVVLDALRLVRASVPRAVQIELGDADTVVSAQVDPVQIEQVVVNLSLNAAQAIGARPGVIEIRTDILNVTGRRAEALAQVAPASRDVVHVEPDMATGGGRMWVGLLRSRGPHARITVTDDGCGMSAETLERIFEPFFTTKSAGGTGIGLAAVNGIVLAHSGAIVVTTRPGRGSTFEVILPIESGGLPVEVKEPAGSGGRERILVIDDEAEIVRMMSASLSRLGYRVNGYTSPADAIEAFRETPDAWDVVVTDYLMPDMTGEVLARELLRLRPKLPIVMCSGYSDRFSESNAAELGLKAFVMKPVVGRQLARTVRRALDDSRREGE